MILIFPIAFTHILTGGSTLYYLTINGLHKIPFATYALEDYDISNPDIDKYPALDGIETIECYLEHGDTLFMPSGWWHWMKYLDGSFNFT